MQGLREEARIRLSRTHLILDVDHSVGHEQRLGFLVEEGTLSCSDEVSNTYKDWGPRSDA